MELPSKGVLYGENHPLYETDVLEIRHMTAKEEDILTSQALIKQGVALDRLVIVRFCNNVVFQTRRKKQRAQIL